MAKALVLQFGDHEFPYHMQKVDRSKLYGFKELEVLDAKDRPCELATLSGDGQTLVGKGGTAVGYLNADGQWCDRASLRPVDLEGNDIEPVSSSFSPNQLEERVSVDEYLEHNIRIVYRMETDEDDSALLAELKEGVIFRFPFSYRGGLEADAAFLLMSTDGDVFMTVGSRVQLEFVGLQQAAAVDVEEDEAADEQDAMDFDMI